MISIDKLIGSIKNFIKTYIVDDHPSESNIKYEKLLNKLYEEEKKYRHGRDV